ncbi:hypothetical protein SERLA73DRAFT_75836 [Serpula lacrymans var. lacrymans S7.3]|uniref:Uncharacterized protein n=2 Tax=Serpula lacrymans var. lacrymans TaxID=341189 RepID=F8Q4D8_SERL3|nr:hypothetical protein SERLA73DRAFT_75836 [Serpula lacrymans var. lacrymans S7.3]
MKAACPTCRSKFYVVSQNLALVPPKYHDFLLPSVRKLFIDIPSQSRLKKDVAILNGRVKSLQKDKDLLMEKCEAYMASADKHAQGEKEARMRAGEAQRQLEELQKKYTLMKKKYRTEPRDDCVNASNASTSMMSVASTSRQKPESAEAPSQRLPARNFLEPLKSSTSSRPKRPLPKSRLWLPSHLADNNMLDPPPIFRKKLRTIRRTDVHMSGSDTEHS